MPGLDSGFSFRLESIVTDYSLLTSSSVMTIVSDMNSMHTDGKQSANRAQKRALRTRKRLLQAALALFCEKGVDATTIEEITEQADLGKGTFYRHFPSKGEVMVALLEDAIDRLIERIRAAKKIPESLQDVLENLLASHVEFFIENRTEFVLLFQGRLLLKLQRDTSSAMEQPFTRYLDEIQKQVSPFVAGPIESQKVRRLAYAVAGFVSGFLSFSMIGMEPKDIEKSIEPFRRAFVTGLLAFLGDRVSAGASETVRQT